MIKYIIKFILFLSNLLLFSIAVFAANISMDISYGINGIAKNGNELPIAINLQNIDSDTFNGSLKIKEYESNESVHIYQVDLALLPYSEIIVSENISIGNRSNTIVFDICDENDEVVLTDRKIIDLSSYNERMIIGVLSSDYEGLKYLDDNTINSNSMRIKLVEVDDEQFIINKNVLNQLDMLIVSHMDLSKLSEGLAYAIDDYIVNGKPTLIGLGGADGILSLPQILYNYVSGPIFDNADGTTNFNFVDGNEVYIDKNYGKAENLHINDNIVICTSFDINKFGKEKNASKIMIDIIEKSLGKNRLNKILGASTRMLNNDFYNANNMLSMIDRLKLPDIYILTVLLVVYFVILIVIIYSVLRNENKRYMYGKIALIFSLIYFVGMLLLSFKSMNKNTFLTYISTVAVRNDSIKEKAFLSVRTSEEGSYSFNTSANNKISSVLMNSNEPIMSNNFFNEKLQKKTEYLDVDNRRVINVKNAKDFDANIFIYENDSYMDDIYNIDCNIKRFDREIYGRITNNMNVAIYDANVVMYGKVLKLGTIEPRHSVSLSRAETYNVPVGNSAMLAGIMGEKSNRVIIKQYLDENMYDYYNNAFLFGFIKNNGSLDIKSNDIGNVFGETLIIRQMDEGPSEGKRDICSLQNDVTNVSGYYDYNNNAIEGTAEVINEYSFDSKYNIEEIYYEELSSYDSGELDYNVPFYGNISIYNYVTNNFDLLLSKKITKDIVNNYVNEQNNIIIKFEPNGRDVLYRKQCLPIFRAIVSKK